MIITYTSLHKTETLRQTSYMKLDEGLKNQILMMKIKQIRFYEQYLNF